ncbi:MAG: metallophosphoesterase [Clostridia bacterium]|nr:metallophosphoesterase [Clostridia bacterium]
MKKILKIVTSVACAAVMCLAATAGTLSAGTVANAYTTEDGKVKYSIAADRVMYYTSTPIDVSINTFEAWIKLPEIEVAEALGYGVIFSDYYSAAFGFPGAVSFNVTAGGNLRLQWGCKKAKNYDAYNYEHTVTSVDLRTNTWTHVAVVRDKDASEFRYYINGELVDTEVASVGEAVTGMAFGVGSDWNNWYGDKTPFLGEIRQVTIYSSAVSGETVVADMNRTEIRSAERNGLLSNWYFTETWGKEKVVEDTADTGNDCLRGTFDKYVPVEDAGDFDYSFMVIPDIQAMINKPNNKRSNFVQQQMWIASHAEELKTQFVLFAGDLTEHFENFDNSTPEMMDEEWRFTRLAMSVLDGAVPYIAVPGNHDYDDGGRKSRNLEGYNEYFRYDDFSEYSYFGGAFEKGHMENTYFLFEVCGVKYLVFGLEYKPRVNVMNWVDRIISEYPDRRVMLITHSLVEVDGSLVTANGNIPSTCAYDRPLSGAEMWDKVLRKHDNMFMTFSGHTCTDYVVLRQDTGDNGNTVTSVLVDAQGSMMTSAMNTFLIVKVNESKKTMSFCYYSPEYDMCYNEQSQFTVSFADAANPTVGI